MKTIYIVKFGLCLRNATTARVNQWVWDSPADGPEFPNPSWSRFELLSSSPGRLRSQINRGLARCLKIGRVFISLR